MAEVHVIGELEGGSDFPSGDLFCKWSVSHGSGWRLLEGASEGQTQIDHPEVGIVGGATPTERASARVGCKPMSSFVQLECNYHANYYVTFHEYRYLTTMERVLL